MRFLITALLLINLSCLYSQEEAAEKPLAEQLLGTWEHISTNRFYCDSSGTVVQDSIEPRIACWRFYAIADSTFTIWEGPSGRQCYDSILLQFSLNESGLIHLTTGTGGCIGGVKVEIVDGLLHVDEVGNCSPTCVGLCSVIQVFRRIEGEFPPLQCGKTLCE